MAPKIEDLELDIKYLLKLCKSQYVRGQGTQAAFEMGVEEALTQVLNYIQNNEYFNVKELNLEHES
jgi:hypothetical protein